MANENDRRESWWAVSHPLLTLLTSWARTELTDYLTNCLSHTQSMLSVKSFSDTIPDRCGEDAFVIRIFPSYSQLSKLFVHLTASGVKLEIANSGISSFPRLLTHERPGVENLHDIDTHYQTHNRPRDSTSAKSLPLRVHLTLCPTIAWGSLHIFDISSTCGFMMMLGHCY